MNAQLQLEEKHDLVKNGLAENLQKKHALELEISQQFEELKKLEISLEKRVCGKPREE
jgi:stress-induced morphogen